jgi:outer membrane protein TolC
MIRAQESNIMASKKQSDIAEQEYAPGWSLVVDYGFRDGKNMDGTDRADFASAMVALDIPLFSRDEKQRNVEASQRKTTEAQFVKDDELRQLKQLLEQNRRVWKRLNERAHLYEKNLLKAAKDNSDAALNAYQSGVSEFNTLMRAQITELDVKLEHLRLLVDREIAKAEILYVTGGDTDETE